MTHATVIKDGFKVPLIGIPPSAVLETCDLCGEEYPMRELQWSGKQMLCKRHFPSAGSCLLASSKDRSGLADGIDL